MKKLVLFIFAFVFGVISVHAAGSASLSVNKSSIENGGSVTASVTVSNAASWSVRITSSGATSGCTQSFADVTSDGNNTTKTFSVTCKATSTGIINFTLSGDVTSSDLSVTKVSGSKQVTVTPPREKSKNNKLKSLSVEGYEISPEFKSDVNQYSVTVPSTVESIKINATKADGYASLEGSGEKSVEEGLNTFEIVVTSETGVSNIYVINVNVEDTNPIEVLVDGKKYTLVKVAKNLEKPELFDETTVKINDLDIPAFKNEASDITLVGLKDDTGKISLFIYDNGDYKPFKDFSGDRIYLIFLTPTEIPKSFIKTSVKINEEDIDCYKINGKNKYILYALNISTGKKNFYSYEVKEKTFQLFDLKELEDQINKEEQNKYIIYGLSGALLLLFILLCLSSSKSRKLKKYIVSNTLEKKVHDEKKEKVVEDEIDDDFKDLKKTRKKRKKELKED